MGAFDYVKTKGLVKCPHCGAKVDNLQTKDFDPLMDTYVLVPPLRKRKRTIRVYGSCDECDDDVQFYFEEKNFKRLPRKKINWKNVDKFIARLKRQRAKMGPLKITAYVQDVDEKIYENFKKKATAEGLSEGEAFAKIAAEWVDRVHEGKAKV